MATITENVEIRKATCGDKNDCGFTFIYSDMDIKEEYPAVYNNFAKHHLPGMEHGWYSYVLCPFCGSRVVLETEAHVLE